MARRRGMQVACGQAAELTQSRPFGLVTAAFGGTRTAPDPRRAAIAALLAAQGADQTPVAVTSDPGRRFRVVDAFADLVEELAVAGPLLIGVDDLPLRQTILRRAAFLAEDTVHALRAAAVLGSAFSLTDVATVTGRPAVELSAALAAAITAGVLDDDGDGLRFRHELIREAIYADLPAGVRRALHDEAGQRLAAAGAGAQQVAEHLARGAAAGDQTAVEWLATWPTQRRRCGRPGSGAPGPAGRA
jgi:hypothetical protein